MAKTKYGQRMYRARKKAQSLKTAAQSNMLTAVEDNLYTRKNEHVAFVDDNGNIVAHRTDYKPTTVSLASLNPRVLDGTMGTHNHPDGGDGFGGTFSSGDLSQIYNYNLKGIRATGQEGTYELIRSGQTVHAGTFAKNYAQEVKRITATLTNKLQSAQLAYNSGLISANQLQATFKQANIQLTTQSSHWLANNAAKYGFTYSFTRRT